MNRNVLRRNKTREGKSKENTHRRRGENGHVIFILSIGDEREILKLIFQYNKLFDET